MKLPFQEAGKVTALAIILAIFGIGASLYYDHALDAEVQRVEESEMRMAVERQRIDDYWTPERLEETYRTGKAPAK